MNKLKYLRESRELLQKDVAYALGISRSAYSNYENNLRCPDPEMLKRMAKFFAVSVDEVLGLASLKNNQDNLSAKEKQLVAKYRSLSAQGKARTLEQLDFEIAMERRSAIDAGNALHIAEAALPYPNSHK